MPIGHILLVDDDPGFLLATATMLRRAGFRVQTASHFGPALLILEGSDAPDLLIADVVVPSSINGIALARMGRMKLPKLRVIYVAGHDIPGVDLEPLPGPLLRKPIEDETLIAAINEVLFPPPPMSET